MKCPICGNEVKFLEKHNMYFCESCDKYYYAKAPETRSVAIVTDDKSKGHINDGLMCPNCLSNNTSYNVDDEKYYCNSCGKLFYKKENGIIVITKCPTCKSVNFSFNAENRYFLCQDCGKAFSCSGKEIDITKLRSEPKEKPFRMNYNEDVKQGFSCPVCHKINMITVDSGVRYCSNCNQYFDKDNNCISIPETCQSCHSRNVFISKSGNNHYLQCRDCGRRFTILGKRVIEKKNFTSPYWAGFWLGLVMNFIGYLICCATGREDAIMGSKKGALISIIISIIAATIALLCWGIIYL